MSRRTNAKMRGVVSGVTLPREGSHARLLGILLTGLCVGLGNAGEPLPEPTPEPRQRRMSKYCRSAASTVTPFGRTTRWIATAISVRVIYTPDGAFYVYDGRPYRQLITHPLDFMPYGRLRA